MTCQMLLAPPRDALCSYRCLQPAVMHVSFGNHAPFIYCTRTNTSIDGLINAVRLPRYNLSLPPGLNRAAGHILVHCYSLPPRETSRTLGDLLDL